VVPEEDSPKTIFIFPNNSDNSKEKNMRTMNKILMGLLTIILVLPTGYFGGALSFLHGYASLQG
jgi:hypothetical protein